MRKVVAIVLVLVAACGGDDVATTRPTLSASIARDRLFDVTTTFELTFVNEGTEAVDVTDVRLRTELFESINPDDRVTTVEPGRATSMPLHYGAPTCDEPDDALRIDLTVNGKGTELDAGRATSGMLRLHAEQCATAAIRDAVDVDFADDWRALEPTRATGTITIDPVAGVDVTLESVSTSIVFVTTTDASLPATDDIEVVVTAARCDAHALTESKKTFLFTLVFTIDGAPPVRLEQRATDGRVLDAMKQAIEECVAARTGH